MGMDDQRNTPAALPPGKTRYPLYRRLGGSQGRSGSVRKISPPHRDSLSVLKQYSGVWRGDSEQEGICKEAEDHTGVFMDGVKNNTTAAGWAKLDRASRGDHQFAPLPLSNRHTSEKFFHVW